MFICKHCQKEFENFNTSQKANHARWCEKNPKRQQYCTGAKQLQTQEVIQKRTLGIKKAHLEGKYINSSKKSLETRTKNGTLKHRPESIELIRQKALDSKHRRLCRSIREYVKKDGSVVKLDSSWEEALAKRLDDIDVEWTRPEEPIQYVGVDGKKHNYFPDFYLPKYDLYLDPKNPAAINAQKVKIKLLLEMMSNLLIIDTLEKCKDFKLTK